MRALNGWNVYLLRIDFSRRSAAGAAARGAGSGEYFERRLVWRQWRLETALAADRDAGDRERRWLLSATNTGKTASIDPFGRIAASTDRKIRTRWLRLMRWFPVPRSIPGTAIGSRICVR